VSISSGLAATCIYGGTPYYAQENELRRGVDVVVGTPGRVLDHLERGNLAVEALEYLVLDEADQMLDIGFKDAIEAVLRAITHPHQTLLYSATVPDWVRNTAQAHMRADKVTIDLVKDEDVKTSTLIEHLAVRCHWQDRQATLKDILLLYSGAHGRTIVFTETKREANELALKADLKGAQALHGDIPQQQRETTLQGFRAGTFRVLIATDVAARGLDIPEVDVVVQCEPPQDVDTYVHRSGRTGRAGKSGVCIVFYKPAQEYLLANIERRTGAKFRRIGSPQPADIMRAVGRDAKKAIERVPDTVLPYFEQIADEMIASHGATRALAAALAHVSGVTQIEVYAGS
jgi:ATP-dependent RNA helicase DDX21